MSGAGKKGSRLARTTIVVPFGGLLFVVLYGVFGVGRDTAPQLHSLRNPKGCAECHSQAEPAEPRSPEPALCRRCHANVATSCEAPREPGERACTSCHDPHGKVQDPFLLRKGG